MSERLDELRSLVDEFKSAPYPIWPVLECPTALESIGLYFNVRTTSWEFDCERTDLHDTLSILFALFLRATTGASSSLWDVPNSFTGIETELYARYITIDQPQGPRYPADEVGAQRMTALVVGLAMFQMWFTNHVDKTAGPDGNYQGSANYSLAESWAAPILRCLKLPPDTYDAQWMARRNPNWMHLRSVRPKVSVIQSPTPSRWLRTMIQNCEAVKTVHTEDRILFVSENATNSASIRDVRLVNRILRVCETEHRDPAVLAPLENKLVGIGHRHIIALDKDCGRKRFESDRERERERVANSISLLYPHQKFEWVERIDDNAFENLVLALLVRYPGVRWARKVGSSRDRDAGRDILAEWATGPLVGEKLSDEPHETPLSVRRVIVQCKAFSRPVDKSRVSDIRDLVEHHAATGYFLAVSTTLTSGLFDHLDRLRIAGRIWIDWWTRSEIEEQLQLHPDILATYSHLVRRCDEQEQDKQP